SRPGSIFRASRSPRWAAVATSVAENQGNRGAEAAQKRFRRQILGVVIIPTRPPPHYQPGCNLVGYVTPIVLPDNPAVRGISFSRISIAEGARRRIRLNMRERHGRSRRTESGPVSAETAQHPL